jgi:hypothetical protein
VRKKSPEGNISTGLCYQNRPALIVSIKAWLGILAPAISAAVFAFDFTPFPKPFMLNNICHNNVT